MKIAIFTQPLHTNFGGTLQAFALQKVVTSFGYEPLTINFRWNSDRRSSIRNIVSCVKQKLEKGTVNYYFTTKELSKIGVKHKKFIDSNIKLSPPIFDSQGIDNLFEKEKFSGVIVGSDQVWRPKYSPRIETFFLDFLSENSEVTKISYAASFGTDKWEFSENQTSNVKRLIEKFDAVSVRESSGLNMCKQYLSRDAVHVLDPTLLITKNDYENLFKDLPLSDNRGIFNYVLDQSEDKVKIISKLCTVLGMQTFTTYPNKSIKDKLFITNSDDYVYPKIELWLKSFKEASYVVTDSFHGTVFSIIFNKPFIAIANEERGRARFISLLKLFGLENRLISNLDELKKDLISDEIDFNSINILLEKHKQQSLDYLKENLPKLP